MNNTKSIAVICNYRLNPDRIGGMDRFFKAYNSELLKQGHQITWFFCGEHIPAFYKGFHIILAKNGLVENEALTYLRAENPYTIVVSHFTALCTSFYRDLKHYGVKRVIAVDHNPRPLEGFPLKKRMKNKVKGMLYGKYIDLFIGVSHYTKKHIIKDYGKQLEKKVMVIHNGIDYTKYKQKDAAQRGNSKFVVVSHLRYSKGIQDLIKALQSLPEEMNENISVDIYGEGPMEAVLKNQVQEAQLEKTISFYGSSSELPQKLHEYDYLLQPTHMECFSLSLLESIAANVPVVTTTVGGNLELIKHHENGFIFEPKNVQQLSAILQDIILERKFIKGDVHKIIEIEFSLEKMLTEHIKITLCT